MRYARGLRGWVHATAIAAIGAAGAGVVSFSAQGAVIGQPSSGQFEIQALGQWTGDEQGFALVASVFEQNAGWTFETISLEAPGGPLSGGVEANQSFVLTSSAGELIGLLTSSYLIENPQGALQEAVFTIVGGSGIYENAAGYGIIKILTDTGTGMQEVKVGGVLLVPAPGAAALAALFIPGIFRKRRQRFAASEIPGRE